MRCGVSQPTSPSCHAKKRQAHRVLHPVGRRCYWIAQTTFVLLVRWPSCKDYCCVAPHAACERCAAPRVASRGWSAAPQVVPEHWHAARDDVPCRALLSRTLLERLILERALPGRVSPERMAVPEPQHLTSLAWWSARQSPKRRLVQIGTPRSDARSFFRSCHNLLTAVPSSGVYFIQRTFMARFDSDQVARAQFKKGADASVSSAAAKMPLETPREATTLDPWLTIWAIAICNRQRGTRR
jgi:hypothetical protein